MTKENSNIENNSALKKTMTLKIIEMKKVMSLKAIRLKTLTLNIITLKKMFVISIKKYKNIENNNTQENNNTKITSIEE